MFHVEQLHGAITTKTKPHRDQCAPNTDIINSQIHDARLLRSSTTQ